MSVSQPQRLIRQEPRKAGAPGAEFAYDTFVEKIREARHDLEQIDLKLAALATVLAAATGAAVASRSQGGSVIALLLLIPIGIAALGIRVRKGRNDPDPMVIVRYAGDDPSFIKELALRSLAKAFAENQVDLESKAWFLNRALLATVIVVAVVVVGKALNVA